MRERIGKFWWTGRGSGGKSEAPGLGQISCLAFGVVRMDS